MVARRKTLIQLTAEKNGINDISTASFARKYLIYKATLAEIELILRNERIAKQSLLDIKTALNDIENGFQDLRKEPSFKNKKDIVRVIPELIQASSDLRFAIELWQPEKKSRDYFSALGWCKEHIFQINLQLA